MSSSESNLERLSDDGRPKLKQTLRGYQIFFIVLSSVIGSGVFNSNAKALDTAGPGGLLLAVTVMAIIGILVMETLSELVQLFPAPNALVQYVQAFVDDDWGWVVGLCYWYCYAATFAAQNLTASKLAEYWGIPPWAQIVFFYVIVPIILLVINLTGVFTFGIIETIGGAVKLVMVIFISGWLYFLAYKGHKGDQSGPINAGFIFDQDITHDQYASSYAIAFCHALPMVAYSFVGMELVAMTAYEAKSEASIKYPSRIIAYVTSAAYFFVSLGAALTVNWNDPRLRAADTSEGAKCPRTTSMIIIATCEAGYPNMAHFLNGFLIFSVLSGGNTALYVASRTLYGITRDLHNNKNPITRKLVMLSAVVPQTGVPAPALLVSWAVFLWLPFLYLKDRDSIKDAITIMNVSSSMSLLIVWASICIAYIRFDRWTSLLKSKLVVDDDFKKFERKTRKRTTFTACGFAQPLLAWFGLAGCLMIVALASASWWNKPATFVKVASAYASPIVLVPLWLIFKLFTRRPWVQLTNNYSELTGTLGWLHWTKSHASVADTPENPQPKRSYSLRNLGRKGSNERKNEAVVENVVVSSS